MTSRFFIVGAARAGTTWLYSQLARHPQVHVCPIKEPHYYAEPLVADRADCPADEEALRRLEAGQKVHMAWIRGSDIYDRLLRILPEHKVAGEATVRYFHAPHAPARIASDCRDSRIIVILRDPVERLLSHTRMDQTIGKLGGDIETAIQNDLAKARLTDASCTRYVQSSLYADGCRRYLDQFGSSAVLFFRYEDVAEAPTEALRKVSEFLEISSDGFAYHDDIAINGSIPPRLPGLNEFLYRTGMKNFIRIAVPQRMIEYGKAIFYGPQKYSRMDPGLSDELCSYFAEDLRRTMLLTGLDLSAWISKEQQL
jgi:Sulfotransferase family